MENLHSIVRPLKELEEDTREREILYKFQSNQQRNDYLLYSITLIFMIGVKIYNLLKLNIVITQRVKSRNEKPKTETKILLYQIQTKVEEQHQTNTSPENYTIPLYLRLGMHFYPSPGLFF